MAFRANTFTAGRRSARNGEEMVWMVKLLNVTRRPPEPRRFMMILTLLVLGLVFWFDHATGPEFALSIFYVIPVAMAFLYGNNRAGVALALAAGIGSLVLELAFGTHHAGYTVHYWNSAVRFVIFLAMASSLAALRSALERERQLSRLDPVTGILNVRAFYELSDWRLGLARRDGRPFTLAFVDIDDFKAVNDRLGHSAGDGILRTLAQAMENSVRATDVVARLGGDEFVLLLPDAGSEEAATATRRLVRNLEAAASQAPCSVTLSVGAVTFHAFDESVDQMIHRADMLMYRAKRNGKSAVCFEDYPAAATEAGVPASRR